MQVALFMFTGDGQRRRFPLQRDITVVGRREDCDLRIPLTEVSRKHCRLVKDTEGLRLEDLGSSNGTFHNGNRVQESMVEPGDRVQVGPVVFIVQIDGIPVDDMIVPPKAEEAASSPADSASIPSPLPQIPRAATKRPATPQGEDFVVAPEKKDGDHQDDVIDLDSTLPSPQDNQR